MTLKHKSAFKLCMHKFKEPLPLLPVPPHPKPPFLLNFPFHHKLAFMNQCLASCINVSIDVTLKHIAAFKLCMHEFKEPFRPSFKPPPPPPQTPLPLNFSFFT